MLAMISADKAVEVELTGERVIRREDGQPYDFRTLSRYEERCYEDVADGIYDLPSFDGEKVSARKGPFIAEIPARVKEEAPHA